MGLKEVMLARMKQSHGLSRPRRQLRQARAAARAAGTIRDAYALKQQRLAPPASARPSQQPPPRPRRRAAVDEREDTILKPRRASTWRERVAAPLRAWRRPRDDGTPGSAEARAGAKAARRAAPRAGAARRTEPRASTATVEAPRPEPARRGQRAQPAPDGRGVGGATMAAARAAGADRRGPLRGVAAGAREPPPRAPPRPRQALPPIQKLPQGGQDRGVPPNVSRTA